MNLLRIAARGIHPSSKKEPFPAPRSGIQRRDLVMAIFWRIADLCV
jgi:hypothetical protein